jgi:hypothetical protein
MGVGNMGCQLRFSEARQNKLQFATDDVLEHNVEIA